MLEELSSQAEMINTYRTGYRNEAYGRGKSPNRLAQVLSFEIVELGNLDVLDTLRRLYGAKIDMRRNICTSVEQARTFICERLDCQLGDVDALWLCCSLQDVEQWYMNPHKEADIWKYTIDGPFLCISDLGQEGIMIAFNRNVTKLERQPIGV